MISVLNPRNGPVIEGQEHREVFYAKDQPEYIPLRVLTSQGSERVVLSRWTPTLEQRKRIAEGDDIFLEVITFMRPLQPVILFVGSDADGPAILDTIWPSSHSVAESKK